MKTLPQSTRVLIKSINAQIEDKNSSQLLVYSQELHKKKSDFSPKVYGIILSNIEKRRVEINRGADKVEACRFDSMVKKFKR